MGRKKKIVYVPVPIKITDDVIDKVHEQYTSWAMGPKTYDGPHDAREGYRIVYSLFLKYAGSEQL